MLRPEFSSLGIIGALSEWQNTRWHQKLGDKNDGDPDVK